MDQNIFLVVAINVRHMYFCNGPKTDEESLWIVFKNGEVFSDFNRHLE
jgi:hypothetical protein